MSRGKWVMSKQDANRFIEKLSGMSTICVTDLANEIEPYCSFDVETLIQNALRDKARDLIGAVRDANGERLMYILESDDLAVHIENCADKTLKQRVFEVMRKRFNAVKRSYRAMKKRLQKIVKGQIGIFDDLRTGTDGEGGV